MPDAQGNASDAELIAAFRAAGLQDAGAIARAAATVRAEGGRAGARNYAGNNPATSVDRGFGQFNSFFHPEVTDACADELNCAARAIVRISNGGTDFRPWAATRTDRWQPLIQHFLGIVGGPPLPSTAGRPGAGGAAIPGAGPILTANGRGAAVIGNPLDAIGTFLNTVRTGFQMAAWRVAFAGAGVLLVGAGAIMFLRAPAERAAAAGERESGTMASA